MIVAEISWQDHPSFLTLMQQALVRCCIKEVVGFNSDCLLQSTGPSMSILLQHQLMILCLLGSVLWHAAAHDALSGAIPGAIEAQQRAQAAWVSNSQSSLHTVDLMHVLQMNQRVHQAHYEIVQYSSTLFAGTGVVLVEFMTRQQTHGSSRPGILLQIDTLQVEMYVLIRSKSVIEERVRITAMNVWHLVIQCLPGDC